MTIVSDAKVARQKRIPRVYDPHKFNGKHKLIDKIRLIRELFPFSLG